MARALGVFILGCLLLVAGTAVLFLAAWFLAALGARNGVGEFVAIGLAVLIPCSYLMAGSLLPGPPRPRSSLLLVCPHCGTPCAVWIQRVHPEAIASETD